ncbi:TPA: hypothetical protein QB352_000473 [Pasteurella multocida]|nr:hypothetical protein [Pasteurella multocida]
MKKKYDMNIKHTQQHTTLFGIEMMALRPVISIIINLVVILITAGRVHNV